jgi:hypothetical protein
MVLGRYHLVNENILFAHMPFVTNEIHYGQVYHLLFFHFRKL